MNEINSRTSPRRILNILEEILLDPDSFTAKKISHKLNIPLATVYRHIETLCDERYLVASNSKKYIPGPKIRNIILHSLPYEPNFTLRRSYLRKLTEEIKETVSLSVPIGTKLVYFDRIEFHWPMQLNLEAGDHLPLHASASGKLYLSSIKKDDALEIFKNINRICKSGLTVLIIEQNVRMALLLADYAYIIRDGIIHLQGKASELVNDDRVRLSYLGGTVAKV